MNISTEKKIMDLGNRLVAAWEEREGVGGIGSVGLSDANYCSWNGFTMRSCCVALRTMSRYLDRSRKMGGKKCIHVSVTWSPYCTAEKIKINKNKKESGFHQTSMKTNVTYLSSLEWHKAP